MTRLAGFGAIAALVLLAGALPAEAQQKTLTVAAYGGVWDSHLRKEVFPEFEKKHGVKVEYVAGNSTDTLAKLQAQKGNQVIDVAIMDDGVMYQAISSSATARQIQGLDKSGALSGRAVYKGRQGRRGRPDRHRVHDQYQVSSRRRVGRSRPRGTISRTRSSRSSW
jgi:putative spermidine/putrescine transport system substrate-binding protein